MSEAISGAGFPDVASLIQGLGPRFPARSWIVLQACRPVAAASLSTPANARLIR